MTTATDGGGGVRIPHYIWHVLVLAVLGGCVTLIASHVGEDLQEAKKVNNDQAIILTAHEQRIGSLEKGQEKIGVNVERILERMPPKQ
jgi:hypothetical protein